MKTSKKLVSIVLAVLMLVSVIVVAPITANAAGGVESKLNTIKNVYPTGSYFTASGKVCSSNQNSDCELKNIPSRGGLPSGATAASVTYNAWSCCSFARYVFYCIFGLRPEACTSVSSSNLKIGDYIYMNSTHYAIYLGQDSNYWYVYNSNGTTTPTNMVEYNQKYAKSKWKLTSAYHATNYDKINGSTPTPPTYNPQGVVDYVTSESPGTIKVRGWAFDKDNINQSVNVDIYAFQKRVARITANKFREDVGSKYGVGNYHGFEETITMPQNGTYNIAIYAINIEGGKDVEIFNNSVTIPNFPQGKVESVTASAPDYITIKGWAFDKDDINTSIYVDIYAFQNRVARITANKLREDIGREYGVGNYHGFEETIKMPKNGTYSIAVYAINIKEGKDTEIYYQSVTVPNYPIGEVESVIQTSANKLTIKGWAFDKDNINTSIYVDIYAFQNRIARITADKFREDIGSKYGVGNYHGFEETIDMPQSGSYNIAIYAINIEEGKDTEIYYQSVTVPNYPIGDVNLDNKVDVKDATLLQKYAANVADAVLNDIQLNLADVKKDGIIDIRDATTIQMFAAGLISDFS